jgi:hypothetical protein
MILLKDLLNVCIGKIQIDKRYKWNTLTVYQGESDKVVNKLSEELKEYLDHEVILVCSAEPSFGEEDDDYGMIIEIKNTGGNTNE